MTKERNGIYNHQQITKNIFKEMVEPTHGVQNVMLGGSMMLQNMMNGPNAKRSTNTTNATSSSSPSAKLATIIEEDDTNTVDFISFDGLVPNICMAWLYFLEEDQRLKQQPFTL